MGSGDGSRKGAGGGPSGLPPVPTGLQRLLRLAASDREFRRTLLARRGEVAGPAGVRLTSAERSVLAAIPGEQLEGMIDHLPPPPPGRLAVLRQTAATAVVLLGGAVLADCTACTPRASSSGSDGVPPAVEGDAGSAAPPAVDAAASGAEGDEAVPERPDLPPPVPAGILPDLPPPRPPEDGGAEDGAGEAVPERPEANVMESEGGISPHLRPEQPHPTRGIRPDLPPPRPEEREMLGDGGAAPDLPPPRPERVQTTSRGGAAPDLEE